MVLLENHFTIILLTNIIIAFYIEKKSSDHRNAHWLRYLVFLYNKRYNLKHTE